MDCWLVRKFQDWNDVLINGVPMAQTIGQGNEKVHGAVGFALIFDDYDKALEYVNGNASSVVSIVRTDAPSAD